MFDQSTSPIRVGARRLVPAARGRRSAVVLMTTLMLMLLAASPALEHPAAAHAATIGRMVSIGGWQVGAFLAADGQYVYCIEPGAVVPSGSQKSVATVSSLPAYSGGTYDPTGWRGTVTSGELSGARLRQINYVLWTDGRTRDVGTAAAVQLAVWILRGDPGVKPWLDHHLAWARAHGGSGYVDHAYQLARNARARALPAVSPQPQPLLIEREAVIAGAASASDAPRVAGGTVRYPAGTTRLTIDGGEFTGGNRQLAVDSGAAGVAEWRALLYEKSWAGRHRVEITGEWAASGQGWPAKVKLYPPQIAGQQRLAAGVGPESTPFSGASLAADAIDAQFSPTLESRVGERFVRDGAAFSDTVILRASETDAPARSGSPERSTGWPSRLTEAGDREYAPIVAEGIVYGPFEAPQPVSAAPPRDAPVAGRARLVARQGPGEYAVEAERQMDAPGYYYWVWEISEDEQLPEVREGGLVPAGYRFADEFGLVAEGHVIPARLHWRTRLESRRVQPDDLRLRDHLTVESAEGAWLRDASGSRVPARIRLTVYRSDAEPKRQATAPEEAREIARGFVSIAESETDAAADPIELPARTRGWVTVQACLLSEDQPEEWRGTIEEWCDDYGVPEETALVAAPPELSRTGAPDDAGPVPPPLLGLGLVGAGTGALLAGGLLRRVRRRSTR